MEIRKFSDFIYSSLYMTVFVGVCEWCVWVCVAYPLCFHSDMSHLFKEGKLFSLLQNFLFGAMFLNYGKIICYFHFKMYNVQSYMAYWSILIKYLPEKWFLLQFFILIDEIKAYPFAVNYFFICIVFYVMLPSCGHFIKYIWRPPKMYTHTLGNYKGSSY